MVPSKVIAHPSFAGVGGGLSLSFSATMGDLPFLGDVVEAGDINEACSSFTVLMVPGGVILLPTLVGGGGRIRLDPDVPGLLFLDPEEELEDDVVGFDLIVGFDLALGEVGDCGIDCVDFADIGDAGFRGGAGA